MGGYIEVFMNARKRDKTIRKRLKVLSLSAIAFATQACTPQLPDSFRFLQQLEDFGVLTNVSTKIDLLWVIDNSASMDVSQQKLRAALAAFSETYMKPQFDIRVAFITTDTFIANSAYENWLDTIVPGSIGYVSPHIFAKLATYENPSWAPNLVNLTTGALDNGITYGEMVPVFGPNYAKLLEGNHDGPITGTCIEGAPYFLNGVPKCAIRDDHLTYNGSNGCLNPDTGSGESDLTQCVNTSLNDTVRSGKAIINTQPPEGTPANAAWTQGLKDAFKINASVGTAGNGSERGFSSVLQLIQDNEGTATALFRKDTVRALIFVADEDDQTMENQATTNLKPNDDYACDQAALIAANPTKNIDGVNGYCCSNPANNCLYGDAGTTCDAKTVDGYTYTVSVCPDSSKLMSITDIKTQFDNFFTSLDGEGAEDGNYLVHAIVPKTAATIQALQAERNTVDTSLGLVKTVASDRGDRYIEMTEAVGGGSVSLDIGATDYSDILTAIGNAIIEKVATFKLAFAPTSESDMLVTLITETGEQINVPESDFELDGSIIKITNVEFVLTHFKAGVQVLLNYQPFNDNPV